jgi:flagellin-specific chaperone FliS
MTDSFEKKPGKFYPVELETENEENEVTDEKLKRAKEILTKGMKCTLDPRVQELVIFNLFPLSLFFIFCLQFELEKPIQILFSIID